MKRIVLCFLFCLSCSTTSPRGNVKTAVQTLTMGYDIGEYELASCGISEQDESIVLCEVKMLDENKPNQQWLCRIHPFPEMCIRYN